MLKADEMFGPGDVRKRRNERVFGAVFEDRDVSDALDKEMVDEIFSKLCLKRCYERAIELGLAKKSGSFELISFYPGKFAVTDMTQCFPWGARFFDGVTLIRLKKLEGREWDKSVWLSVTGVWAGLDAGNVVIDVEETYDFELCVDILKRKVEFYELGIAVNRAVITYERNKLITDRRDARKEANAMAWETGAPVEVAACQDLFSVRIIHGGGEKHDSKDYGVSNCRDPVPLSAEGCEEWLEKNLTEDGRIVYREEEARRGMVEDMVYDHMLFVEGLQNIRQQM